MSNNRRMNKEIMEHSNVTDIKKNKGPLLWAMLSSFSTAKRLWAWLGSCSSTLVGIVRSRGSSELERAQPATATISSWDWTQPASVCKELHVTHMTYNL